MLSPEPAKIHGRSQFERSGSLPMCNIKGILEICFGSAGFRWMKHPFECCIQAVQLCFIEKRAAVPYQRECFSDQVQRRGNLTYPGFRLGAQG